MRTTGIEVITRMMREVRGMGEGPPGDPLVRTQRRGGDYAHNGRLCERLKCPRTLTRQTQQQAEARGRSGRGEITRRPAQPSTVSSGKALKVREEVSRKREWTFYLETFCCEIFNLSNFSNFAFSLLTDRQFQFSKNRHVSS